MMGLSCLADANGGEWFKERRACWARQRDAMIGFQKEAQARGDREGARFFSTEAAFALKYWRGADFALRAWEGRAKPADVPAEIEPLFYAALQSKVCGLEPNGIEPPDVG